MPQFSAPHLAALAVLVMATAGAVWTARRRPGAATTGVACTVAGLILAAWAGEYLADVIDGTWSIRYTLPLQLTDVVSVTAAVALLTRRRLAVELTYFWSLSASLQATVTPDLGQNFPSVFYFTYFTYHVGAIMAGCMLVFGCGLYPRRHGAWRAFAATLAFAAVSGTADLLTGGNYMYLRVKPEHNSLLSVMGPWPWYIVAAAAIGLVMLLVLQWLAGVVAARDRRAVPAPAVASGTAPAVQP